MAVCCIILAACLPEMKPLDEPPPSAPTTSIITASDVAAMQSPQELDYRLNKYHAERQKPTAHQNKAKMKPNLGEQSHVQYFDKWHRPEVHPTQHGFYREIIGRTDDGRMVLQDFYQDNNTPFTSPYIVVKGAKLRLFGDTSMIDSRVAWYAPDGSLIKMLTFKDGKEQGEFWLFENNRLSAYILNSKHKSNNLSDDKTINESPILQMQFFYPSGRLMAERNTKNNTTDILFYYETGAAMLCVHDTPQQSTRLAWDKQGKPAAFNDVHVDLVAVQKRIQNDLKKIKYEKDIMYHIID